MRFSLSFILLIMLLQGVFAQSNDSAEEVKLYNPDDNAKLEIEKAIQEASVQGKHVFLQIGGNWCSWCVLFNNKVKSNDTLLTALEKNYVVYHVNYSKENKNEEVLAFLGYPQRFGFPVFVILDDKGNRLHTQNSAYLEEGRGHSTQKVLDLFNHWSPAALDPENYR
jgi:thioredoxin-related protein